MTIIFNNKTLIYNFIRFFSSRFNLFDIYLYEKSKKNNPYSKTIAKPDCSLFDEIMHDTNDKLDKYFKTNIDGIINDRYISDYLKKCILVEISNYSSFIWSVKSMFNTKKVKILGDNFLINILLNRNNKKNLKYLKNFTVYFLNLRNYLIILWYILNFSRNLYYSNNKSSSNKIIRLLKKEGVGRREGPLFESRLNEMGIQMSDCVMLFSCKGKYKCLRDYPISTRNNIQVLKTAVKEALKNLRLFIKASIPPRYFQKLCRDVYLCCYYKEISKKITLHNIQDKAFPILIYKYCSNTERIICYSQANILPEEVGYNYIYCHDMMSVSPIEANNMNRLGGKVGEYKYSGFVHSSLMKYWEPNISSDLLELIERYKFKILVATNTVTDGYFPLDIDFLDKFLYAIFNVMQKNSSIMFILKEKKGELQEVDSNILKKIIDLPNVHIVKSLRPMELKNNRAEDLIFRSDLLISMFRRSAVMWQAIAVGIPVVGIRTLENKGELSDIAPFIESDMEHIEDAVETYSKMRKPERKKIADKLAEIIFCPFSFFYT